MNRYSKEARTVNNPPLDIDRALQLTVSQLVAQHDAICNQARFGRACPELVDAYELAVAYYCRVLTYQKTGEWKP